MWGIFSGQSRDTDTTKQMIHRSTYTDLHKIKFAVKRI